MTVLLFTTTDVRGSRRADFERLLASVDVSAQAGMPVRHHVLLQNCTPTEHSRHLATAPAHRRIDAVPGQLSLSAARNHMISTAQAEGPISRDDIVGFPDDD